MVELLGDPDLALDAGGGGHLVEQQFGEGVLCRRSSRPRRWWGRRRCREDDLDADRVLFDRRGDRLEQPRVAVGVVLVHDQAGAAGLGVAATHPAPDTAAARDVTARLGLLTLAAFTTRRLLPRRPRNCRPAPAGEGRFGPPPTETTARPGSPGIARGP
ncbi:hypothetical protein [Amycolatopsis sp. cmx-4-61]|uniref:hypothetical protein n=1 Tax=Amycolatopsis sp. cmx-4-61 TaxID=2790937 RepID=UPI00397A1BCC